MDGVSSWPRRCTWTRVDFTGASLAGAIVGSARFEDCDFADANLKQTFFDCDLIRCRFAGHLCDVVFIGGHSIPPRRHRIEGVDMSGADLHHVAFRAVDLADFQLPADPRLRVVSNWRCVHARLDAEFRGKAREQVPVAVRVATIPEPGGLPKRGAMVLELATIAEDATPEDVADLERLLDDAEAACR